MPREFLCRRLLMRSSRWTRSHGCRVLAACGSHEPEVLLLLLLTEKWFIYFSPHHKREPQWWHSNRQPSNPQPSDRPKHSGHQMRVLSTTIATAVKKQRTCPTAATALVCVFELKQNAKLMAAHTKLGKIRFWKTVFYYNSKNTRERPRRRNKKEKEMLRQSSSCYGLNFRGALRAMITGIWGSEEYDFLFQNTWDLATIEGCLQICLISAPLLKTPSCPL